MSWTIPINHASSICKLDALTSVLHSYAGHALSAQPDNISESPSLGPLPLSASLLLGKSPPPKGCPFYIETNHPATFLFDFSYSKPLYICLNHPRARYQTLGTPVMFPSPLKPFMLVNHKPAYSAFLQTPQYKFLPTISHIPLPHGQCFPMCPHSPTWHGMLSLLWNCE